MAASSVLFIGWNRPFLGREKQCTELFTEMVAYAGKQKAEGNLESFEPVFLSVHGGDMNGFFLFRGERQKLDELRNSDTFLDLITVLNINAQGVGVVPGWVGEGVMKQMARFQKAVK